MNLFLMFYTSGHLRNIDLTNVCFHLYFLTNRVKVSTKSNFSHLHRTDRQTDRQTQNFLTTFHSTTSHRCHVGDVLRLFGVRGEPHDAHVQREHNFRLRVD